MAAKHSHYRPMTGYDFSLLTCLSVSISLSAYLCFCTSPLFCFSFFSCLIIHFFCFLICIWYYLCQATLFVDKECNGTASCCGRSKRVTKVFKLSSVTNRQCRSLVCKGQTENEGWMVMQHSQGHITHSH